MLLSSVDCEALTPTFFQVAEHLSRHSGARSATSLKNQGQILLDATVLEAEVDFHLGARREDPGPEGARGLSRTPRAQLHPEDGCDLLGATDIDVVLNERLEKAARPTWVVKDEGAADFHLAHGELVVIASLPVGVGERARDERAPAVEEGLDVTGPETVADSLKSSRILTGRKAIGEFAKVEPGAPSLALGPLMSVQPDLSWIGKVGARLDEARSERVVVDVEVVGPDPALFFYEVKAHDAWLGRAVLGAVDPLELLGVHDGDDVAASLGFGFVQVGTDVVELAVLPARAVGPGFFRVSTGRAR